jgi:hypothetical protein
VGEGGLVRGESEGVGGLEGKQVEGEERQGGERMRVNAGDREEGGSER